LLSTSQASYVAFAPFLLDYPQITTLGIRPGLVDYSREERDLLSRADRVLFPTRRFVQVLDAAGKATFPSAASYLFRSSRLLQHYLFAYYDFPVPRTRVYYGHRQKAMILKDFSLPLVAMASYVAPGAKRLIDAPGDLWSWVTDFNPVIVQEFVPLTIRVRLVCVNYQCLGGLTGGGYVDSHEPLTPINVDEPQWSRMLEPTLRLLRANRLDDVMVEWGFGKGQWWVLGMLRPPVKVVAPVGSINRHQHMGELFVSGRLS
jgi:hypothetical protein